MILTFELESEHNCPFNACKNKTLNYPGFSNLSTLDGVSPFVRNVLLFGMINHHLFVSWEQERTSVNLVSLTLSCSASTFEQLAELSLLCRNYL